MAIASIRRPAIYHDQGEDAVAAETEAGDIP